MVKRNDGMKYLASLILCLFLCGCGTHAGKNEILIGRKAQDGPGGAGGAVSAELFAETGDSSGQDGREGGQDAEKAILVHVCGAVKNPGVVSLPEGSRAQDALDAAGGFSENAGRDFVNLAEPVQDGQKPATAASISIRPILPLCVLCRESGRQEQGTLSLTGTQTARLKTARTL